MTKVRLEITKGEAVRYISHLDYSRTVERALRRARLPVAYSEGFNPHMKMAFASALSLGVTSEAEYLDVEMKEPVDPGVFAGALSAQLPPGIKLKKVQELSGRPAALMALVNLAVYRITAPLTAGAAYEAAAECIARFNQAEQVTYIKESPKSRRQVEIKQYLARTAEVKAADGGIELELAIRILPSGSIKPSAVLSVLIDQFGLAVEHDAAFVHRVGLFVGGAKGISSPLDFAAKPGGPGNG